MNTNPTLFAPCTISGFSTSIGLAFIAFLAYSMALCPSDAEETEAVAVAPEIRELPRVTPEDWATSVRNLKEIKFGAIQTGTGATCDAVRVYAGYTSQKLYVLFVCTEPEPDREDVTFTDPVKDHDLPVYSDDCVELFVASDPVAWGSYYQIAVNPAGVVFDARCEGAEVTDRGWSCKAEVRTHSISPVKDKPGYWLAEMAIPFSAVGNTPAIETYWGVNFARIRTIGQSTDYSWAPISGSFHRPDLFEPLFFGKAGKRPRRPTPVIVRKDALPAVNPQTWQEDVKGLTEMRFGVMDIADRREPAVRVFLAHDTRDLYALFACTEPNTAQIRAMLGDPAKNHDGPLWSDDCVELYMVTDPARSNAYSQVIVNSKGVVTDTKCEVDRPADAGWTANARVKTYIINETDRGPGCWLAEIRLPFDKLGGLPPKDSFWKINLTRQRKTGRSEDYTWAPIVGTFHRPLSFLTVKFE